MGIILAVFGYLTAIVLANLSVSYFGPSAMLINSFIFIGFDLTMRDYLNMRINGLWMCAIILAGGVLSYFFNPDSLRISAASSISFFLSSMADWGVFKFSTGKWLLRSNKSNVVGAAIDSIFFPTIAFAEIMPVLVVAQFLCKTIGGLFWSLILNRFFLRSYSI